MGNKQDPLELGPRAVKSAQPCLSQARGQDDQTGLIAGKSRLLQSRQSLLLDLMRLRGGEWRLQSNVDSRPRWLRTPRAVPGNPLRRENCGGWASE